jgi:hypothetical protein
VVEHVLSQPAWKAHPELASELIDRNDLFVDDEMVLEALIGRVLSLPAWSGHPELVAKLLERGSTGMDEHVARSILGEPHWGVHPEWVRKLIDRESERHDDGQTMEGIAWALAQPRWKPHPELVLALIAGLRDDEAKGLVNLYNERKDRGCKASLGDEFPACFRDDLVALVSTATWRDDPTLRALCGGPPNFPCVRNAMRNPASSVQKLLRNRTGLSTAVTLLSDPKMAEHPRLAVGLITRALETGLNPDEVGLPQLLEQAHWRDHPFLRRLCHGEQPTVECLQWVVVIDALDEVGPLARPNEADCR